MTKKASQGFEKLVTLVLVPSRESPPTSATPTAPPPGESADAAGSRVVRSTMEQVKTAAAAAAVVGTPVGVLLLCVLVSIVAVLKLARIPPSNASLSGAGPRCAGQIAPLGSDVGAVAVSAGARLGSRRTEREKKAR